MVPSSPRFTATWCMYDGSKSDKRSRPPPVCVEMGPLDPAEPSVSRLHAASGNSLPPPHCSPPSRSLGRLRCHNDSDKCSCLIQNLPGSSHDTTYTTREILGNTPYE